MTKIVLISYYGLTDALLSATRSLEKNGHSVVDFPMFKYAHDINDKIPDYTNKFIAFVKEHNPDVILWWFFQIPTSDLKHIWKNTSDKTHLLFCWDDPYIWTDSTTDIRGKCKYFDIACITCDETPDEYVRHGTTKAYCVWPGHDPEIFKPITSVEYDCDISICCTNLYSDMTMYKDQIIPRKKLIDMIALDRTIKFNIYGPEFLKTLYPNNYKHMVNYDQLPVIFNRSKINICTHVIGTKRKYINERVVLILASGGLLYVDGINGLGDIIDTTDECVVIDTENPIQQIHNILDNYEQYTPRKIKGHERSKTFTWDIWASKIHEYITSYKKDTVSLIGENNNCPIDDYINILNVIKNVSRGNIKKILELEQLQLKLPFIDISKIIENYIILK